MMLRGRVSGAWWRRKAQCEPHAPAPAPEDCRAYAYAADNERDDHGSWLCVGLAAGFRGARHDYLRSGSLHHDALRA